MTVLISKNSRLAVFASVLALVAFSCTDAFAWGNFSGGCNNCHSDFAGFGEVHQAHVGFAAGCDNCHIESGDSPDVTLSEAGDRGCMGCHGRLEDAGNDSASEGLGAGLRQHHDRSGVDSCGFCHTDAKPANYTPVGEDVLPPFYGVIAGIEYNDPGTDGIDNDGDLLYDGDDPDIDGGGGGGGGGGNSPPVVDEGGPYSAAPGADILFDASGTTDADGDTLTYLWTFGDGTAPEFPSTSPTITHAYESAGTYDAKLVVTDAVNDPVVVEFTVTIGSGSGNSPPTADAGGPYLGVIGENVQLDASGSSDPDGDTLTYIWDFGDGSAPSSSSLNATINHTYTSGGTYTVTVTVDDGVNTPDTATATVEINSPPEVEAGGPYSGKPGESVTLTAAGTFDIDGDALTYIWDFGDGSTPTSASSSPSASHTYSNEGTYIATVTVDDGVNDPVLVDVQVDISDSPEPPGPGTPGAGDWLVRAPLMGTEIIVRFEPFAGILLAWTTHETGEQSIGVGMEMQGVIFWIDITGSLYFGNVNHDLGTMQGVAFGGSGLGSPFFGEFTPSN